MVDIFFCIMSFWNINFILYIGFDLGRRFYLLFMLICFLWRKFGWFLKDEDYWFFLEVNGSEFISRFFKVKMEDNCKIDFIMLYILF